MARYVGQSRRFNRRNRESPWYGEWSEVLHQRVVDAVDNALLIPQLTLLYETNTQLADMLQKKAVSSTDAAPIDVESEDEVEEEEGQDLGYDSETASDEEDLSVVIEDSREIGGKDDTDEDEAGSQDGTPDVLPLLGGIAQLRLDDVVDQTDRAEGIADEDAPSQSGQDPDTSWSSTGTSKDKLRASRIPDFSIVLFDVQNPRVGGGPIYLGHQIHAHRVAVLVECKKNISKKISSGEADAKRLEKMADATFQLKVQAACVFLQDSTVEKAMAIATVGPWWYSTYLTRQNIPFAAWDEVGWISDWDESRYVPATWSKDMLKLGTLATNAQLGRVKRFLRHWNTKLGWD
jgi:hypothetical protein